MNFPHANIETHGTHYMKDGEYPLQEVWPWLNFHMLFHLTPSESKVSPTYKHKVEIPQVPIEI